MRVVYTCPKCGSDIDEAVLCTYPPRYLKYCKNMSCGWSHMEIPEEDAVVRIPYEEPAKPQEWKEPVDPWKYGIKPDAGYYIPECCRNCQNHPSNGGSGVCNCTLPSMTWSETKGKISFSNNGTSTASDSTDYMFGGMQENV